MTTPDRPQKRKADRKAIKTRIGTHRLLLDNSGALVLPDLSLVAFADLHFEKGSAFAKRGVLLPPYDSATTLDRMEAVLACYRPDTVVCLGDSFHDIGGGARMVPSIAARLRQLADQRDWIWIQGNHDPGIPDNAAGRAFDSLEQHDLLFLHELKETVTTPQIAGHFHPKVRIKAGPRRITRPCFIGDGQRLILPSFGAYTGGLDIMHPAIANLFPGPFTAWVISQGSIYAFPSEIAHFLPFKS
ncbi:MAG: ligase-associated DNA damage response endonuclease PdeM [Rhodospirillaceae bacterium]|nr:ligase-associated DNA damage response endonuclease PdeM [Rhodospirillaceae bacterium]